MSANLSCVLHCLLLKLTCKLANANLHTPPQEPSKDCPPLQRCCQHPQGCSGIKGRGAAVPGFCLVGLWCEDHAKYNLDLVHRQCRNLITKPLVVHSVVDPIKVGTQNQGFVNQVPTLVWPPVPRRSQQTIRVLLKCRSVSHLRFIYTPGVAGRIADNSKQSRYYWYQVAPWRPRAVPPGHDILRHMPSFCRQR